MVTIEAAQMKFLHFLKVTERTSTAKRYGNSLRVWMRWIDDARLPTPDGEPITRQSPLVDVNSVEIVAAFYAYLKRRRKSDGTPLHNNSLRSHQHALRALWKYCCDQKMWAPELMPLTFNAVALVPIVPKAPNHRDHATLPQVEAMLDACDRMPTTREAALAYAVLQVVLMSGVRRDEMIYLEVSDYHRKEKSLYVRHAKGGTPRTQRLDTETCNALEQWLRLRGDYVRGRWEQLPNLGWRHIPDETAPDFLFTSSPKRHLGDAGTTTLFRKIRAAAGLREHVKITPHTLRHFQCHRVYEASGLRAAQKYAGHKSERTTWQYIRPTTDTEMDAVLDKVQLRPSQDSKRAVDNRSTANGQSSIPSAPKKAQDGAGCQKRRRIGLRPR